VRVPDQLAGSDSLRRLGDDVATDSNVVGVVLSGSQARLGMATGRSDIDVYVVTRHESGRRTTRSAELDAAVCTLDRLRMVPGPEDPAWWDRYSFTHSQVLLDRSDGEVTQLVRAWGTLSGPESKAVLETYLDGYVNYVYRSLKTGRDGRALEARLDAAESLVWGLPVIFAFERRVRPYNKYLGWELRQHPLERSTWQAETLLDWIEQILHAADPAVQRALFRSVEEASREVGLDGIIDAWGDELILLRGP
jgi:hypothetical protein